MTDENVLRVPAREVPLPDSISPEAQAALTMGFLGRFEDAYPEPDDIEGWRALVKARDAATVPLLAPMAEQIAADRQLRDAGGARVYVVTPEGCDDDRVVLDVHGGAFLFFGAEGCEAMTAFAAREFGCTTWGVDYRMPPDHPYPAGLDDCLAAYRALLEERGADRIVVRGTSAGGNLAAALVVRARDEGLPLPAAVVLSTPEVDLTESGDSFRTNLGVDNVLGLLRPINELYANGTDLTHPYLSPLFADLTGYPPTILTTGTRDLFLSNTVRMHRALRRARVVAELHVLEAAPHGNFLGLAPEDRELAAEVRTFVDRHCPPRARRRGITIFRREGAPGLFESGTMSFPEFDPQDLEALAADGPGSGNVALGNVDAVLFRGDDGFSLVRAWFAPHYVLPRHSHDGDCLYLVVEGSLTMGAQTLVAGDGFFVPSDAPYAYEAGPEGVSVVEFRTRTSFGMKIPGGQVERLRRMAAVADEHVDAWRAFRERVLR